MQQTSGIYANPRLDKTGKPIIELIFNFKEMDPGVADLIRHFFYQLEERTTSLAFIPGVGEYLALDRRDLPKEYRQDEQISLDLAHVPAVFKHLTENLVLYPLSIEEARKLQDNGQQSEPEQQ